MDNYFINNNFSKFASGFLILCSMLLISCSTTRIINTTYNVKDELASMKLSEKYIIIHEPDTIWRLEKAILTESKNELIGTFGSLENFVFIDKYSIVHLEVSEYIKMDDSKVKIPVTSISRIEAMERKGDVGKSILGTTLVMGGIGLLFYLMISSITFSFGP